MRGSYLAGGALALILSLSTSGCLFDIDLPGNEGRPCSSSGTCLAGYECVAGVCQPTPLGVPCDSFEDDCAVGFCWSSFEGGDFCTIACGSSSDCPGGFRCSDADEGYAGSFICLPDSLIDGTVGAGGFGASCAAEGDCQSGLCEDLVCTDTCQSDDACGSDGALECRVRGSGGRSEAICSSPASSGESQSGPCATDADCARGLCADDGAGGGLCTDPCCSSAECPPNFICWLVLPSTWVPGDGMVRTCVDFGAVVGTLSIGDGCSFDGDCQSGTCLVDPNTSLLACTDTCCTDANCPLGYQCKLQDYDVDGDGMESSYLPFCVTRP